MQSPTNDEIQREIDSIRSMRRISSQSGPGSLTLDPDLPPQSPSGSSPGSSGGRSPNAALPGSTEDEPIIPNDSGHGFFWVPASLHPELAPSEFKAFLRNHKREGEEGGEDDESSAPGLSRMSSGRLNRSPSGLSRSSSGLGRKKSMLSRQYQPREGDTGDAENDEQIKPMKRNRSIYSNDEPQLTIKDLQKLDDLADAAAAGNNTESDLIRRQLRRSMSMGYTGNIIDQIDAIQEDEEPVIVPAKALQRTARTRIRKPGLEGDGNGHRFASTRRGKRKPTLDSAVPSLEDGTSRPASDMTSSDRTSLSDQEGEPYARPSAPSPDLDHEEAPQPRFAEPEQRPISIGESIYDAYGSDARESTYYDARESLYHRESSSGDYANVTSPIVDPAIKGAVIYDTADDEPFFIGAHPTATASLPNVAITSETRDTRGPSGPGGTTVVLRSRSPDREQEQLPLTRQGSAGRKAKPPESIEMPQNQHASRPSRDQQYYQSSQKSQNSNYPQPLPPSQQMYQSSQQQYEDNLHHPTPKRHLDVPNTNQPGVSPPSSPELIRSPSVSPSSEVVRPFSAPPTSTGRPTSAGKEKEKEKSKGRGWFGLGGGGKEKVEKEKEKEKDKHKDKEKEKTEMLKKKREEKKAPKEEKESGGLFGIFGSKKPKQDNEPQANGNANANSMSGKNGNRQMSPFATVSPAAVGQYARYPLHVERAIYRLSHIKLANPRRPLYEQVLISNLMFWYLGIINKPAVPPGQQQQQLPANNQGQDHQAQAEQVSGPPPGAMNPAVQQAAAAAAAEKARLEQEQLAREKEAREREEQEREMREQQEQELREREQREKLERERLEKEREKPRKSLNKAERDGRSRKADMPVKTPNYDAQSRTMDQERANGRPNTSPTAGPGSGPGSGYGQPGHTSYHLPQRVQQPPSRGNQPLQQPLFYQQDMNQVVYQPMNHYALPPGALPPGAKPPAVVENTWAASSTNDGGRSVSKSPPPQQYYSSSTPTGSSRSNEHRPRPSRSPPPHDYLSSGIPVSSSNSNSNSGMPNGARPGRSLSANAVNKKSPGPTPSESYPPTTSSNSSRQNDYDRDDRPSHQYSQSASASLPNGNLTSPKSPPIGSSGLGSGSGSGYGTGKLIKKKSTTNVQPSNVAPSDGTKPIPRRRKSMEAGAADRRGVVEPEVPFENLWQFQGYGQQAGYTPQAQKQGWGSYN